MEIEVEAPPPVSTSLQKAEEALQYFQNPVRQRVVDVSVNVGSAWRSRLTTGLFTGTLNHFSKLVRKSDYINGAKESLRKAKERLDNVQDVIHQWTVYRQSHKSKLNDVKANLLDAEDRVRKSLLPSCIICLEHPKEVVFQCGHQCCKACAEQLSTCHTCRETISQRIKLYD